MRPAYHGLDQDGVTISSLIKCRAKQPGTLRSKPCLAGGRGMAKNASIPYAQIETDFFKEELSSRIGVMKTVRLSPPLPALLVRSRNF